MRVQHCCGPVCKAHYNWSVCGLDPRAWVSRQQGLACRCLGGAEMQQSLLVRLQNLCQLEALLAHTLTLLPNLLPGQTPATAQPKATVSPPRPALPQQLLCCQVLALLAPS